MENKDICLACESLEKTNYEFIQKGVTDEMCESLKNDSGLKASNGHTNCEDLHDMNDCLVGGMIDKLPAYDVCDMNLALEDALKNLMNVLDALICSDCGQWESIHELWDEIKKLWDAIKALQDRVTALENAQNGLDALGKLLTDLKNSGAWVQTGSTIYQGKLNTGRHLATGNINLFGGTLDGNYFIRTNSGKTENDLAGGV